MTTSTSQLSQFKEKLQQSNISRTPAQRDARLQAEAENVPPKSATNCEVNALPPTHGHSAFLLPRHIERRRPQHGTAATSTSALSSSNSCQASSVSSSINDCATSSNQSSAQSVHSLPSSTATTATSYSSSSVSAASRPGVARKTLCGHGPIRFDPNALMEDSDSDGGDHVDGSDALPSQTSSMLTQQQHLPSQHPSGNESLGKPLKYVGRLGSRALDCSPPLPAYPPSAAADPSKSSGKATNCGEGVLPDLGVSKSTTPAASVPVGLFTSTKPSTPPASDAVNTTMSTSAVNTMSTPAAPNCSQPLARARTAPTTSHLSSRRGSMPATMEDGLNSFQSTPATCTQVAASAVTVAMPTPDLNRTSNNSSNESCSFRRGHAPAASAAAGAHVSDRGVSHNKQVNAPPVQVDEFLAKMLPISVQGNQFLQLSRIGKGGCGQVYRGLSSSLELVAIKHVDLCDIAVTGEDRAELLESCLNEIRVLEQLQHSEHIVKLHCWEMSADKLHIHMIMECGEYDLASFLVRQRRYLPAYRSVLWQQMLSCVQAIHEQRIVHSDLKPANFVFFAGVLKLIDFGIAGKLVGDVTSIARDARIGTPNYMAPECIRAQNSLCKANPKSDVWSLGCILYRMVYNRTPFQHFTDPVAKFCAIIDDSQEIPFPPVPSPVMSVLKKCLTRELKVRASVGDLMKQPLFSAVDSVAAANAATTSTGAMSTASVSLQSGAGAAVAGSTMSQVSLSRRTTTNSAMPVSVAGTGTYGSIHSMQASRTNTHTATQVYSGAAAAAGSASVAANAQNPKHGSSNAGHAKMEATPLTGALPALSRQPSLPSSQSNVLQFLSSLEQRKGAALTKK